MDWLNELFSTRSEVTSHILGPEAGQEGATIILNRVIRQEQHGIAYEPDQRHTDITIRELDLSHAHSANSAGSQEEM